MRDRDVLPPGPKAPAIVQLVRLVNEPFELYAECAAQFGPVFTLRIFGQGSWVILGDPESVRIAFHATADEFLSASEAMQYLIGKHAVLLFDGEKHRRERRILTPPFKHERMATYAARMIDRADDAIDRLRDGTEIRAIDLLNEITMQVIVECVFGVSNPVARDRLAALFARHLTSMQTPTVGLLSMGLGGERLRELLALGTEARRDRARTFGPLPSSKNPLLRFLDTKAEVDAMMRAELERCRRDGEGRDDVLALLARATYEDGTRMSDEALLDELVVLLFGGHETSAITLAWTLYFLAKNPEKLARARAELDEVFGSLPVNARSAEKLSYLSAVIDETMRLRPVATSIPRKLAAETTLGGHRLPAGTRVFPSPAILHFREDLFPDPHAFEPARFVGRKASPFHYFPFGGASRACLGRPFALLEMKLVLAQLLRRIDFELLPRTNPKAQLRGLLVGPSDGVPLRITRVRGRTRREDTTRGPRSAAT